MNFPSNPSVNDTYTLGDKIWVYNGIGWELKTAPDYTKSITLSFNHANSAFIQANSAFNAANTITVINGLFFTG